LGWPVLTVGGARMKLPRSFRQSGRSIKSG
jgi:hypothetical protein